MRARRSALSAAVALIAVLLTGLLAGAPAAAETLVGVNGSGSTYVGIAMRQWVAQGQSQGWSLNYQPLGSPTGMNMYNQAQVDFAGTEAEFVSLGLNPSRGYQYVPDVAGATAIMYNIKESSGRQVDYLHLSRQTVARIFIGTITRWSDPAISTTNKGIRFPDLPIRVVLRGNSSGTTALFYDFIAKTLGAEFTARFTQFQCGAADVRPVLIQCTKPGFIPSTISFNDSDQIAQYVAGTTSLGSIAFDEFGYAKVYKTPTAWIQNAAGQYVLPYAQNISAALESARLRPDLSQDLTAVYASASPTAYPISAYSYLVTQCATVTSRPTCKGSYPNPGQSATLARWMSYIACDGQVTMAAQGYSPLPVNLSQEMANSVSRLTGQPAVTLSASNCANPRFKGSLGAGSVSPCDPFLCGTTAGGSSGGGAQNPTPTAPGGSSGAGTTTNAPGAAGAKGAATPVAGAAGASKPGAAGTAAAAAAGKSTGAGTAGTTVGAQTSADGRVLAVGGGSEASDWRAARPVQFAAAVPDDPFGWLPAVLLLALLLVPTMVTVLGRRSSR